jgi:hypothetical protein
MSSQNALYRVLLELMPYLRDLPCASRKARTLSFQIKRSTGIGGSCPQSLEWGLRWQEAYPF